MPVAPTWSIRRGTLGAHRADHDRSPSPNATSSPPWVGLRHHLHVPVPSAAPTCEAPRPSGRAEPASEAGTEGPGEAEGANETDATTGTGAEGARDPEGACEAEGASETDATRGTDAEASREAEGARDTEDVRQRTCGSSARH